MRDKIAEIIDLMWCDIINVEDDIKLDGVEKVARSREIRRDVTERILKLFKEGRIA
jgi:hypothetical protein